MSNLGQFSRFSIFYGETTTYLDSGNIIATERDLLEWNCYANKGIAVLFECLVQISEILHCILTINTLNRNIPPDFRFVDNLKINEQFKKKNKLISSNSKFQCVETMNPKIIYLDNANKVHHWALVLNTICSFYINWLCFLSSCCKFRKLHIII